MRSFWTTVKCCYFPKIFLKNNKNSIIILFYKNKDRRTEKYSFSPHLSLLYIITSFSIYYTFLFLYAKIFSSLFPLFSIILLNLIFFLFSLFHNFHVPERLNFFSGFYLLIFLPLLQVLRIGWKMYPLIKKEIEYIWKILPLQRASIFFCLEFENFFAFTTPPKKSGKKLINKFKAVYFNFFQNRSLKLHDLLLRGRGKKLFCVSDFFFFWGVLLALQPIFMKITMLTGKIKKSRCKLRF